MSNSKRVEELKEMFKQDTVSVFMVHRRVMTDLYKEYGLNGYEIELLLLVISISGYSTEREVKGIEIRNKCSRRFTNVLGKMVARLSSLGFIEDCGGTGRNAHHRIRLTEKGISFSESFFLSLNRHLDNDGVSLRLNARYSWEREATKKKSNERGV